MELKFIYANCTGNAENSMYPNTAIVHSKDELHKYMKYDYTFIEYKNNHRCGKDFIRSVYATFDVDNTTTDDSSTYFLITLGSASIGNGGVFSISSGNGCSQIGSPYFSGEM